MGKRWGSSRTYENCPRVRTPSVRGTGDVACARPGRSRRRPHQCHIEAFAEAGALALGVFVRETTVRELVRRRRSCPGSPPREDEGSNSVQNAEPHFRPTESTSSACFALLTRATTPYSRPRPAARSRTSQPRPRLTSAADTCTMPSPPRFTRVRSLVRC